jgi:hypothetical protein
MIQKTPLTVDLKDRQLEFIRRMIKKHDLPDEGKAIRILVDFAMHESAEEERIFTNIRCSGC